MSTGALSLFGDSYEPADPPASDRCPACGGPSPKGRTCARCKAAGIEAARLDLAPATACADCGTSTTNTNPPTCAGCRAAAARAALRS